MLVSESDFDDILFKIDKKTPPVSNFLFAARNCKMNVNAFVLQVALLAYLVVFTRPFFSPW